jgi:hypothetical protein
MQSTKEQVRTYMQLRKVLTCRRHRLQKFAASWVGRTTLSRLAFSVCMAMFFCCLVSFVWLAGFARAAMAVLPRRFAVSASLYNF